jgi:23S rRNA (cytosine1962-C5)-methyltransferase
MHQPTLLITKPSQDYELIDSGEGEKLERYGDIILSRPDPQALWRKSAPQAWKKSVARFTRAAEKAGWQMKSGIPERWKIELAGLNFWIRPTSFKHTGLFPEQSENWKWIEETVKNAIRSTPKREIQVINLFGYTGGASLAAAKGGAHVCHLDGSKVAITWARDNAEISGLKDKPIRWILDDARVFLRREIKRGRKYDGIIMDPPAFGHGPNKELWKIEDHFLDFLDLCKEVLSDDPLFVLINGYASGYSSTGYDNNLTTMMAKWKGETEIGELAIEESASGRLLPCGIFARWKAKK